MSEPLSDAGLHQHLTLLNTRYEDLRWAHDADGTKRRLAQTRVLQYYQGAVYRYIRALVRDADKADDIFQNFALRFVRGDFKAWNPARGRFRDYLKQCLRNLVTDSFRGPPAPGPLGQGAEPMVVDLPDAGAERAFEENWIQEVLRRAWDTLRRFEEENGQPVYTVLRCNSEWPELHSHQVAEVLAARLGKPRTASWVRKWLKAARARFAALLLNEVERSLPEPCLDELNREVAELGLSRYCREALELRRPLNTCAQPA
jgi:RNA polymerase sigma-70 factor (ECF subfamily)